MIDRQSTLRLPLMDHLVQHRVLDFRPRMAVDVAPAERNLRCLSGFTVDRKLAEAALHSAGKPDGNGGQPTTEVPAIQLVMERFQAVDQAEVSRPSPFPSCGPLGWRDIRLNRKIEELSFCSPAERTGNPRIQEAHDRLQHVVRSKPIPAVNSEHPPAEA